MLFWRPQLPRRSQENCKSPLSHDTQEKPFWFPKFGGIGTAAKELGKTSYMHRCAKNVAPFLLLVFQALTGKEKRSFVWSFWRNPAPLCFCHFPTRVGAARPPFAQMWIHGRMARSFPVDTATPEGIDAWCDLISGISNFFSCENQFYQRRTKGHVILWNLKSEAPLFWLEKMWTYCLPLLFLLHTTHGIQWL